MPDITDVLGAAGSTSPYGAILSAIPSLFKLGAGIGQSIKARNMAEGLTRPVLNPNPYQIPPEVAQYLNMTLNRQVDPRLAGQSIIEDKLGANTSNAVSDVTNRGGGLNTLSSIYGKQMDATSGLGVEAAQNYQNQIARKQNDVGSALQYSAGQSTIKQQKDLERYMDMFKYNQAEPYSDRVKAISALREGGNQNIYGGLDDLSMLGATALFKGLNKKRFPTSTSSMFSANNIPSSSTIGGAAPDVVNFDTSSYA